MSSSSTTPLKVAERPDLGLDRRREAGIGGSLQFLASGDAGAQHIRIVQGLPDGFPAGGDAILATHFHVGNAPEFPCIG